MPRPAALAIGISALLTILPAYGQVINKAATGIDLADGLSWEGGSAPGSSNTATWTFASLGAGLMLGSDTSWRGIDVQGALTTIDITGAGVLNLGASGVNLAAIGQDLILGSSYSVGTNQIWNIETGRLLTLGGLGSGAGNLEITGDGILRLNNTAPSRTGTTTLTSGSIVLATGNNIATSQHFGSDGTPSSGPNFLFNGGAIGSADNTARFINNNTTIGGAVRVGGPGFGNGSVTLSGATTINAGSSVHLGKTVNFNAAFILTNANLSGASLLTSSGHESNQLAGVLSNGAIEHTAGDMQFNAATSGAFDITISGGSIIVNNTAASNPLLDVTLNSGLFRLAAPFANGTLQIGNLTGVGGTINCNFGAATGVRTLQVNQSTDGTFAGVISQAGARLIGLEKAGDAKLTLTGNSTNSGGYTITAGTLEVGDGGTSGLLGPGSAVLNNSILAFNRSDAATVANAISGTGVVNQIGSGTTTLTGDNTYSGATTVSAGTLVVNGSISGSNTTVNNGAAIGGAGILGSLNVLAGGNVNPGASPGFLASPGILNTGNLSLAGALNIEIAGTTPGVLYDQLNAVGTVNLTGGTLSLQFDSFAAAIGDLFFILTNDGVDAITGTFSGLPTDGSAFSLGGQQWRISYAADFTAGTFTNGNDIALMAVPEPNAALALIAGISTLLGLRRSRA